MSEEEAIKILEELSHYCALKNIDREDNKFGEFVVAIQKISNLIQKQQKEIDKLKNKNKDLLEKLRNRVKEVKKLAKYSLYKKEFSKLNEIIQKKDKIIELMAPRIYLNEQEREEMKEYIYTSNKPKDFKSFVKQYFEKQAKEV